MTLVAQQSQSRPAAEPDDPRSPGTLEMVERLQLINERMDVVDNPYENQLRAAYFQKRIEQAVTSREKLDYARLFADELLKTGESRRAIEAFEAVIALEEQLYVSPDESFITEMLLGTAWLRVGEQENCIFNHTTESCLLPIEGGGIHQRTEGSLAAVEVFRSLLENDPSRLDARWLLNIGEMTLGRYPEVIPAAWRIPESTFRSDFDIGRFTDVAGRLGLDNNDVAGGTIVDDFNNDGMVDVMLSGVRRDSQLRYYENQGDGTFTERTRAAGLEGLVRGLNLIQGDYNNDGFIDVLVLRGAWMGRAGRIPNSLLKNNGDGTFSDVTREAGLIVARPTQTAVFLDYDNDGWLDLCVGNESTRGNRHRVELFHNNRDGTFSETSIRSGLRLFEFVKGVASADYNNDGRPDLYFSILGGKNQLFRNDGPAEDPDGWTFTHVTDLAGLGEPVDSFPCWFFDFDNDGFEDIFSAGYNLVEMDEIVKEHLGWESAGARMKLHRNRGDGTFEDVTARMNLDGALLAMGVNFGDLDNDGWLDFYVGTGNPDFRALFPNRMFRNHEGQFFQDVTTSGGFGHLQKGHAIAFADLDLDGDQDVYANMGGAYYGDVYRNALFENPGHGNHWLKIQLVGKQTNRQGVGARIKVVVQAESGARTIYKTVNSGGSFGANPLRQEIGLGRANEIRRVEIFWPVTGRTQVVEGLLPNQSYTITEGEPNARKTTLNPTPFTKKPGGHVHH